MSNYLAYCSLRSQKNETLLLIPRERSEREAVVTINKRHLEFSLEDSRCFVLGRYKSFIVPKKGIYTEG
ncbi:MAG: hypothetical protein U5L45_20265 [Saprospiraceae bacterium]|nr:hypothetical protein [Saprospiraceae bacterium]